MRRRTIKAKKTIVDGFLDIDCPQTYNVLLIDRLFLKQVQMNQIDIENVLFQNGSVSLAKAAMLCSMIDNDYDEELVTMLSDHGVKAVITRAGGSGDNLKSKILRNTFGAAENSGLIAISMKNRHVIMHLVDGILSSFDSPLMDVAGGGLKIGLVVRDSDIAMGIFGNLGLPGLDVDYEISASRILYHCLED